MDAQSIRANFEARSKAAAELRALYDEAAGREMTAEERQTEERLAAAIEDFDRRIDAGLKASESEKRAREAFEASDVEPEARQEQSEEQTDADVLRAMARGEVRSAEFGPVEARANEQVINAGGQTPKAAGGYTVPQTFYARILEALEEHSTVILAGATVIRTESGEDILIPKATGFPSASLVSELGQMSNQKVTFDQATLKAYKFGFTMEASSELLTDSGVDIASYLAQKGGEALGWGLGSYAMTGSGSSQPQGVLASSGGFTTVDAHAGSAADGLTVEDVIDLVYSIKRPYRTGAVFIASDAVVKGLRKLREDEGKGAFLWQPSTQAGEPDTLAGYPIVTDPAMDDGDEDGEKVLAFGNWSKAMVVRFAGPIRVEASTDFHFDKDTVTWRFITRFDSRIVDTNAAKVMAVKAAQGGGGS